MLARAALCLACLIVPVSGAAQDHSELRERWQKEQQSASATRRRLLEQVGFRPLDRLAASGQDVRQVRFVDPYFRAIMTGVEMQRHPDGGATLRMFGPGGSFPSVEIPREDWAALLPLEEAAFRPPRFDPAPYLAPPPRTPSPVCHGWGAVMGRSAGGSHTASWFACVTRPYPAQLAYAEAVARLAVRLHHGCALKADAFASFALCSQMPLPPQAPRPE